MQQLLPSNNTRRHFNVFNFSDVGSQFFLLFFLLVFLNIRDALISNAYR